MSRRPSLAFLAAAVVSLGAAHACGQQAGFVLLQDYRGRAVELPPEHRFVHPVTAPFFHEDAFVTTDLRAWYLYHDLPKSSPIDGGKATAVALQLRLALTDRVQLVAYKDGYTIVDSGLVEDEGFNDIALGLKVKLVQDWENQLHVAVGVGYEFAVGEDEVFQDDDEWRFWVSANKGFDRLHLGAVVNFFFCRRSVAGAGQLGPPDLEPARGLLRVRALQPGAGTQRVPRTGQRGRGSPIQRFGPCQPGRVVGRPRGDDGVGFRAAGDRRRRHPHGLRVAPDTRGRPVRLSLDHVGCLVLLRQPSYRESARRRRVSVGRAAR